MKNKDKIILDLCGGTGAWSKPYSDAGYKVLLITLPKYDVRYYDPPKNVYGILAAPPCDKFSILRHDRKECEIESGVTITSACMLIAKFANPRFFALENPASGRLRKHIGEPLYSFEPWWFGDSWSKRTALWGRFNIPIRQYFKWEDVPKIPELYTRPGRGKPSIAFCHKSHAKYIPSFQGLDIKNDAEFKAITPQGFAKAFYEANK